MTTENHKNKENHSSDEELIARLERKMQSTATAGKASSKLNNKDTLIIAVLVIIVIISGWQTAKLSGLNNSTNNATVSRPSNSGGGSALPASLQNLPAQVGGC